jgi:peptidoglycan/LPS O-acetylase OafA/YrhL
MMGMIAHSEQTPDRLVYPPANQRMLMLDAGRLMASVAIVWLHACILYPTDISRGSRFAVPFFSASAAFLLCQGFLRRPNISFIDYASKKVRRLYFPFLGWSLIYLLSSEFKRRYLTHTAPVPMHWAILWVGSSLQLWFLPFILFVSIISFPFLRFLAPRRATMRPITIGAIAVALIVAGVAIALVPLPLKGVPERETNASATYILAQQSWATLPALLWGFALAVIELPRGRARKVLAVSGGILFLVSTSLILARGRNGLLENMAGISAMIFCLAPWDSHWIRQLARWGTAAYGIYLAHVLFIEGMFALLAHAKIQTTLAITFAEFTIALVLSAALVWTLNRSKYTQWLNG